MAFGLGRLRLAPDHFWTMTPREMAAAMAAAGRGRGTPPGRAALAGLMERFPDIDPDTHKEARWLRK